MAMQAKTLIISALIAVCWAMPVAAADWGGGRGGGDRGGGEELGRGGNRWRDGVFIEPNIDLNRPKPNVDDPNFIMAEISQCSAAGMPLFVDCLRQYHGAIMIRRLEACVGSETIPADLQRVAVCIPPVPPTAGQ
jgi:hypothetical protein